jgi:hypothetical protein
MYSAGSRYGSQTGFCGHGIEHSVYIEIWNMSQGALQVFTSQDRTPYIVIRQEIQLNIPTKSNFTKYKHCL